MRTPTKDIIKKLKDQGRFEERANYTFRLRKNLMATLRSRCEKEGIKMTGVLEELIAHFLTGE